jgi:hypothetical protein
MAFSRESGDTWTSSLLKNSILGRTTLKISEKIACFPTPDDLFQQAASGADRPNRTGISSTGQQSADGRLQTQAGLDLPTLNLPVGRPSSSTLWRCVQP